jgi:zinc transporter, ZIP family
MLSAHSLVATLLIALLPALGMILGVLLAEWRRPSDRMTGAALHMAAGVATAVAAIELLPRAQERSATWVIAIALLAGAAVSVVLFRLSNRWLAGEGDKPLVWGAYMAMAVDLTGDGLMTGAGSAVEGGLGLLLALSQIIGNLPGGFAVTAGFRKAGLPRRKRMLAAISYPVIPLVAAATGFLVLDGAGPSLTGFVLALLAGLLITTTIEDLVPEADQAGAPRRISSPAYAAGFAVLLLMSGYLG